MKALESGLNQRNLRIDLLRGLSILLVLIHHFNIPYKLTDTFLSFEILGWDPITAIARNGNYGVTMFFVISGFLITSHSINRWKSFDLVNAWSFYGLRIARIIPSLLLLLLIVNGLGLLELKPFINHAPNGIEVSYSLVNFASITFWMNVLIIKYGWVNYALGVLWSLAVEEVFYLSFPIACLLLKKEKYLVTFWLIFIIAAPIYRYFHQNMQSEEYLYAYLSSFDGIAIGCCAALIARYAPLNHEAGKVLQVMTVLTMTIFYLSAPISQTNILGVTFMSIGTAILLISSVKHPMIEGEKKPNIVGRMISRLGQNSYELYLFHLVVLGLIKVAYPPISIAGNQKILLLILFLSGSIILSEVIAKFYSNPLNRLTRKKFIPRKMPTTVNFAD